MLLVEEVLLAEGEKARVRAKNAPGGLFADGRGGILHAALVEMVAQAYAAFDARRRYLEGTLPACGGGFLVNVRGFEFFSPVREGQEILVDIEVKDRFFDTRIVEGTVWADGVKAAAGQVYIFVWEGSPMPEER